MKKLDREKIQSLNNRLKKKKYVSILFAFFTFGVNIFAWFAFSANAGLELDATVASWDVEFKDDNDEIIRNVLIEVTKMKPGMDDYSKRITINNNSDVDANFSFHVTSFRLLGIPVNLNNISDVSTYLNQFYPFSIQMVPSNNMIPQNSSISFDVLIHWPFESQTPLYFGQNEVYQFMEDFFYYQLIAGTYQKVNVTRSNYLSQRNLLFLEKDDADTFFGMQCHQYEENSGDPCLVLNVQMLVEQRNA